MKLSSYTFLTLLFFSTLSAHPAKKVKASRVPGGIKILIFHKVRKPQHHFLDHIVITYNGQIIDERRISKTDGQSSKEAHEITLPISLNTDDQITVFSHCNEGGDLEQTVTIDEQQS